MRLGVFIAAKELAIRAGGPGSGKRPGFGVRADMPRMRATLLRSGYKQHASSDEHEHFIHPQTRDYVKIHPETAKWQRVGYYADESGKGIGSLDSYLHGAHKIAARRRLAAGGPGSGCRGPNCGRPSGTMAQIQKSAIPLTPAQTKAEAAFRRYVANNLEGAKAAYRAQFGNVLNADNAKELSPHYRADRTNMAVAVHEPSSFLVKQLYKEELAKPAPAGKENAVLFTAGGAGAGKTSGLQSVKSLDALSQQVHMIYDGTLRPVQSALTKVKEALDAGKQAIVVYVHRDPIDAMINGVVPRAERTGRTVPLDEYARQHAGIQESMRTVSDTFKDHPNFSMVTVDNSHGAGQARLSSLDALPINPDYASLKSQLQAHLDRALASGKISPGIYNGITKTGSGKKEVGI